MKDERLFRAVPELDPDTRDLVGVTLTSLPERRGAGFRFLVDRPDLDAALVPPRGWHWHADADDYARELVCRLAPTDADILEQVAEDLGRGAMDGYRLQPLADTPPAEQLRGVATRRMSLPPDEAEFQCARLLRQCQDHLRRTGADDED